MRWSGLRLNRLLFLFFFGGESIHAFALALAVGIFSGAYSSIFNAAMVVVQWFLSSQKRLGVPVQIAARTAPQAQEAATAAAPASDIPPPSLAEGNVPEDVEGEPAEAGTEEVAVATKARAQSAKRKRQAGKKKKSRKRW